MIIMKIKNIRLHLTIFYSSSSGGSLLRSMSSALSLPVPDKDTRKLLRSNWLCVSCCSIRWNKTFPFSSTGSGSAGDSIPLQYSHGLLAEVYTTKN